MEQKKLTRSQVDKKIAGICGGLGKYFNIDPIIFRLIFLFLLLCAGGGLVLYLIFWIAVPSEI